jgi:E3 ubiquitin-protein ligase SHPRH
MARKTADTFPLTTRFHAAPMHGAAASSGGAPCPLCRKPFFIEELIRLLPNEVEVDDDGDGDDDVSRGKGEGTERGSGSTGRGEGEGTVKTKTITGNTSKGKGKALAAPSSGTDNATDDAVGSSRVPKPKFSFAATPADFARLPLPSHENPTDHRDGRYPALSMDGGRFLAHVHRACARQSPKISAVVSDLREAIAVPNGSGKAVVFSQLRDALAHCADALTWEGIGNVLVDGGVGRGGSSRNTGPGGTATATDTDTNGNETTRTVVRPEDDAARAVQRFRDDEDCHVLLLHAGSASAGLTLTHADLVILLEPFLSPGDEAQAANRVHRIGQKRPVRCVTYFVCGSVEERLLAFRERQAEFGGGEGDGAGGSGIASATTTPNAAASASALGVAPENETDAFSTHMSRAQFHRMRFVFGLASGENGENGRGRAE